MQQYYDLEINIMSCLLLKPELMKDLKLEDKYFIKHQRLWQFMKAFYKRYQTYDIVMMYQICKDKYQIAEMIQMLVGVDPITSHFNKYQNQLIELYNESKKERYISNRIYNAANELYLKNICLVEFKERLNKIEKDAEQLFGKGE